jgi:hypothetical protein
MAIMRVFILASGVSSVATVMDLRSNRFSVFYSVQTDSGAHKAYYPKGTEKGGQ